MKFFILKVGNGAVALSRFFLVSTEIFLGNNVVEDYGVLRRF
jgi:hypothetical protein